VREPPITKEYEASWAAALVWTFGAAKILSPLQGIKKHNSSVFQHVMSHHIGYVTPFFFNSTNKYNSFVSLLFSR